MIPSPFTYPQSTYQAYPPVAPGFRRGPVSRPNPFAPQPLGYSPQRRPYFQQQGVHPVAMPPAPFQQNMLQSPVAAQQQRPLATNKQTKKPKVHPIGFLFPAMTLVGTPLMLISSVLGVHPPDKNKVTGAAAKELEFSPNRFTRQAVPWLQKLLKTKNVAPLTDEVIKKEYGPLLRKSYQAGKTLLALGIIPKTIIGMLYGIRAQQPSILFAHLLQLPLTPLILKDNPIATSLAYMMGGLFTLGFINDVENGQLKDGQRDPRKGGPRFYDMTRFKQVFSSHSGLSLFQRATGLIGETLGMTRFMLEDHVRTIKRAVVDSYNFIKGRKSNLQGTDTNSSTAKSSLGFLLCYMATVPSILANWLCKDSKSTLAHAISKYSMATTILSGLMLNFGMILVALTGKNWAERLPLVGTGMELSGTVMGYTPSEKIRPFALALQQLGAGLNSVFFANKAEKSKSGN